MCFSEDYYTPTVDVLRLRDAPGLKGKIIGSIKKGEKVSLLMHVLQDVVDGKKGDWVKVKTEIGEIGYCFDGYLTKIKDLKVSEIGSINLIRAC